MSTERDDPNRHVNRIEHTPNGKRYRVECIYCAEASRLNPELYSPPKRFSGRPPQILKHIKDCRHYQKDCADSDTSSSIEVRPWNAQSKAKLEALLAAYQHRHRLPDAYIEAEETIALYEFLCPGVRTPLPSRRVLGGRILDQQAAICEAKEKNALLDKCESTGGRINVLSDVWENISRVHLLGSQLTLFGTVMTYELSEVGSRHDGVAIAVELDGILRKVCQEWAIGAVVTDNAGQCGRARRILALRWPRIVFLHCFAHDINNLVKAVLKTAFRVIACVAAAIVNALNASSSKWLKELRTIMERRYGKPLALYVLCDTRWNSMQACFASLLRVRKALELLAFTFSEVEGFPRPLLKLLNPVFWQQLGEAERVIRPLSAASYRLQRDCNTLADVVICFRDIFREFDANPSFRRQLVPLVEHRWSNCEQPLFMLGFLLHPLYAAEARKLPETAVSSRGRLSHFVVYYYRRFFSEDYGLIRDCVDLWLDGKFTETDPNDYGDPVVGFWKQMRRERKASKLPDLAIAVLSIAVNTATCERLFSELGMIHTAVRNRMTSEKARKTQVIRHQSRQATGRAVSKEYKKRIVSPVERSTVPADQAEDAYDEIANADILVNREASRTSAATPAEENVDNDDDLDPPGDTVEFWETYLDEISPDMFLWDDDSAAQFVETPVNAKEPIPPPDETPFPEFNDKEFPQEKTRTGIRAITATLRDLFGVVGSHRDGSGSGETTDRVAPPSAVISL